MKGGGVGEGGCGLGVEFRGWRWGVRERNKRVVGVCLAGQGEVEVIDTRAQLPVTNKLHPLQSARPSGT